MGAAQGFRAWFGHAEVLDLALRDQFLDRAGNILDRHVGIDAVLVQQVDLLDAEPLQRSFRGSSDALRLAVRAGHLAVDDVESELGGDHHPIAERPQRLADDFFIGVRTVDFRGVEEGDAAFDRLADQRDAVLVAQGVP